MKCFQRRQANYWLDLVITANKIGKYNFMLIIGKLNQTLKDTSKYTNKTLKMNVTTGAFPLQERSEEICKINASYGALSR